MKYFNYNNFMKRYNRLGEAFLKELSTNRKEAILVARKELFRLWRVKTLKE